ncbi:MAG: chloride channel protein [Myxococcota bacterium]
MAESHLGRRIGEWLGDGPTRWIAYGIGVGLAAGAAAVLFAVALELAEHLTFGAWAGQPVIRAPGDRLLDSPWPQAARASRWIFFVLPVLGGLASGLVVYWLAPEAGGPGTDQMIRDFHENRGRVRPRVPLVKGIATLFTLAGGGSAGKEGPIAQIGGGIGAWVGERLGLSARDRRILLLAGAAGGLGAIFRAPLGSALTAIEVLYMEDFESDALVPCVISSVTAYVLFVSVLGGAQIFAVPPLPIATPIEIPGYLLLALVAAPVGRAYIALYYGVGRGSRRLPISPALIPMLGGLGVGVIGLAVPQAYGAGWGVIQQALDGQLLIPTMILVLFAKIAATSLTIGSGGSGGVFGPTLFIGGMLGGAIGFGGHGLLPAVFPHPEAYVLVGMASFFAGVASAPIGAMLMVAEMTGGYALLPPLMLVSIVAIVLARHHSIYETQVLDRFHSPAHVGDLTMNVLEEMTVAEVFQPSEHVETVTPGTGFQPLRDRILESRSATLPVVSAEGKVVGLVTAEQIRPVMDEHQLSSFVVAGDIAAPPVTLQKDDDLYRAHALFRVSACPQIPVIEPGAEGEPDRILGMLDYRDMMRAYERELAKRREEQR